MMISSSIILFSYYNTCYDEEEEEMRGSASGTGEAEEGGEYSVYLDCSTAAVSSGVLIHFKKRRATK